MAKRDAIVDCNWSKASIKQMDAAARRYQVFIREHTPWQPFPVTYNTMSCWLADAQFDRCKASTVVTYARNLRGFCNRKGIDCMEFSSKIWKAFEGGLRAGRSNEVKRSTAVTMQVLARVRPHMRLHDPKQRQRWLHLLLMHDAMLRGGDCTGERMLRKHVRIEGRMLRVTLDKHKHNRKSAATSITVAPAGHPDYNTPAIMREYLRSSGISAMPEAPLFAKLDSSGRVIVPFKQLSYQAWNQQFRSMMEAAGVVGATPHGCRAGGLSDAVRHSPLPPVVMARRAGWSDTGCWQQYLRADERELAQIARNSFDRVANQDRGATASYNGHPAGQASSRAAYRSYQFKNAAT